MIPVREFDRRYQNDKAMDQGWEVSLNLPTTAPRSSFTEDCSMALAVTLLSATRVLT